MTQTPMEKAVEAAHAVLESYWTTGPEVVEEALTAALSALEAEGFVVAPVEPTKEMHDAGALGSFSDSTRLMQKPPGSYTQRLTLQKPPHNGWCRAWDRKIMQRDWTPIPSQSQARHLTLKRDAKMANRTFPSYFMYKDNQGLWRWRYDASNGLTIAVSSESYLHRVGSIAKGGRSPLRRGEDSTFPRILPQQTNPPLSLGLGYGMEIHRVTRRINVAQNDSFRTVTNRLNVSIVI